MFRVLCGVPVDPCVEFAFFPSQVLANPVGAHIPFPPIFPDGALRDGKYRGYLACRQHPVRAAEGSRGGFCAPLVGGRFLFLVIA